MTVYNESDFVRPAARSGLSASLSYIAMALFALAVAVPAAILTVG